jgi:hypothetical protein
MPVVGARAVVDAADSFLKRSGGNFLSFNDELAAYRSYRSQRGLTSTQLPDIATFGLYAYLGSAVQGPSPYMVVEWDGSDPETENMSHKVPHRLSIYLLLVDHDMDQPTWENLVGRALEYDAVMRTMFLRSTVPGTYGYTLNNGGSGDASGRISRATIETCEIAVDPELNSLNVLMRWGLTVVAIEDWPGT